VAIHLFTSFICFFFFLILLPLVLPPDASFFWTAFLGFLVIAAQFITMQIIVARQLKRRSKGVREVIDRIVAGDLTLGRGEIRESVRSSMLTGGLMGLSRGIGRLLRRFQAVQDQSRQTSVKLHEAGLALTRSAVGGSSALDMTAEAIGSVYHSQSSLHESIERLGVAGEDTASSILQMSASLEEVSHFVHNLFSHVAQVNEASEDIFASIRDVQEHIQHLSSFGIETATSMQEMRASIEEIDHHSQTTSQRAEESRAVAMEGKTMMGTMVSAVDKVQDQMGKIQETMGNLEERTRRIGDVVTVITDITKQTNLLALNAAIIAAQGKDKGKGFAVVAEEIRDLSERTAHSTEEINTLVSGIQQVVKALGKELNQGTESIRYSVSMSRDIATRFDQVLSGLEISLGSISQIATMTREQNRNSDDVARAVEEVSERIQEMNQTMNRQVEKTRYLSEFSRKIVEGVTHIQRSTEEQSKSSAVIMDAVNHMKGGIHTLAEASDHIVKSNAMIMKALGELKQTVSQVMERSSAVRMLSDAIQAGSADLETVVSAFQSPEPRRGGELKFHIAWKGEMRFDPLSVRYMETSQVTRHIFETLVDVDRSSLPVPLLARSWEMGDGGRTYTVYLRDGVAFHNGHRFTSKDVVWTFRRLLMPESPSLNRELFCCIEGARDFMEGRSGDLPGVSALDSLTVQFRLDEPLTLFPILLAMNDTAIVPADEEGPALGSQENLPGTGPFLPGEVKEDDCITLLRNDRYHQPGSPLLKEVHLDIHHRSSSDILERMSQGELDMVLGVLPTELPAFLDRGFLHVNAPTLRTTFVAFNQEYEPLQNARVRQALNLAINRDPINQHLYDGHGIPASGILPPVLSPAGRPEGYVYNPDLARDLLADAGFSNGLRLSIWVREEEDLAATPIPAILEDFRTIGVFVDVEPMSSSEIQRRRSKGQQSPLFLTGWYADYPDPDSFFSSLFLPESDAVNLHLDFPAFHQKIEAARREPDMRKRRDLYGELNRIASREALVLFLFHPSEVIVYSERVQDVLPATIPPFLRFGRLWLQSQAS